MSETPSNHVVRCAIYTRSATNDKAFMTAQEQNCRAAIKQHPTWEISEGLVFSDLGASGSRCKDREGLNSLLQRAEERPRPFDYVVFDDTSRLSRNLSLARKIIGVLTNIGIGVYFVDQKMDSIDPNFRMLFGMPMMEEEYVSALRETVRRGQHGRVQQGYTPGGRCFGYESHPVSMPAAEPIKGHVGTKLKVVGSEAETIRKIYRLYADGVSVSKIVRRLNGTVVRGPAKPATSNAPKLWNHRLVRGILKRERYRGTVVWGRTARLRHPVTGRIEMRRKPDGEIIRVPAPELRIVDDELAAKVDARLNSKDEPGDG